MSATGRFRVVLRHDAEAPFTCVSWAVAEVVELPELNCPRGHVDPEPSSASPCSELGGVQTATPGAPRHDDSSWGFVVSMTSFDDRHTPGPSGGESGIEMGPSRASDERGFLDLHRRPQPQRRIGWAR